MNEERFSASDLELTPGERRVLWRDRVDRMAATVAVLAVGVWVGGMVALGSCAAPFVFRLTPAPFSGNAMGSAFARFDQIALGAAAMLLAAEVARTWAAGRRARHLAARVRRLLAFTMAGAAAVIGLSLTPQINALHRAGIQRGVGEQGDVLDRVHRRAEAFGKAETGLGVALVVLHIMTIARGRLEDDDEGDEPLPPGPREG